MRMNRLGKSELYVSEIGLGCMSFKRDSEQQAIKLIHRALDQGLNFVDTADLYEFGYNEQLVAKALKGKRNQVIVATKVGNHWNDTRDGWQWDPRKSYITEQVQQSLKRLQTDYIDLYQLHGGTIDDPYEETIEAFEELQREGYIRYYGISSIRPNVIRRFVQHSNIVSVMLQYSMLDRRPEEELLDLLAENQISVIARGPVAQGLLSNDWLRKIRDEGYLDYTAEELKELLPQLKQFSEPCYSLAQLALRYVLCHPAVATVIPGVRHEQQLNDLLDTIHRPELTDDLRNRIQSATKMNYYIAHR